MDAFEEPVYCRGEAGKFTVKATMSSGNWIKFMGGELSPVNAALTKKMKIEGASVALTQLPLAVLRKAYQEAADLLQLGKSGPAKGNER
jgi:putative sterol carrier protein